MMAIKSADSGVCRDLPHEGRPVKNSSIIGLWLLLSGSSVGIWATPLRVSEQVQHPSPAVGGSTLPPALEIPRLLPASPLVVDAFQPEQALRIVAERNGREYFGTGDRISVQGELDGVTEFSIFHPGAPLHDPASRAYLGREFAYAGRASLLASNLDGGHRFLIIDARREITVGDYLLPLSTPSGVSPENMSPASVDALIVSIHDGTLYAAQHQIVAINKGVRDGIREGVQLRLYAAADRRGDSAMQHPPAFQEERGRLLVFRVFDRVSYGLIVQASAPVQIGDKARAP